MVDARQGADGGGGGREQGVEVVAALQDGHAPACGHQGDGAGGEQGVVAGREAQIGEGVGPVRVEAGRDQEPGGPEALDGRLDEPVEGGEVDVAPLPSA